MTDPAPSRTRTYLALDEVLGAQRPRSDEHDELLFIVIHQVYELWFKQLLHELATSSASSSRRHAGGLHTLRRILTILKVAVAQIDVLETMTPRQFTSFRDRLDAAERVPVGAVPRAGGGARRARSETPAEVTAPERVGRRWSRPSVCGTRSCATSPPTG